MSRDLPRVVLLDLGKFHFYEFLKSGRIFLVHDELSGEEIKLFLSNSSDGTLFFGAKKDVFLALHEIKYTSIRNKYGTLDSVMYYARALKPSKKKMIELRVEYPEYFI